MASITFTIYSTGVAKYVRVIDHNGSAPQENSFPKKDPEPWSVIVNSYDEVKDFGNVTIYVHLSEDGPSKIKHDGDVENGEDFTVENGDLPSEAKKRGADAVGGVDGKAAAA